MTYSESIQFLYELQLFGAKFGLENTRRLAALTGNPQEKLRFIHVAGTNGKGSTCAMLESIYRSAGYRVGLYTSPHLVSFCERIQVNRQPISEQAVTEMVQRLRGWLEQFPKEQHPTFFEVVTVMALLHFAEQKCDLVIWETGMGGRLDATNIVNPLATVITNVALDHQRWLGDTIEKIAAEKAGIIKPGVPVITGETDERVLKVIGDTARKHNARIVFADTRDGASFPVSLAGNFQQKNAATAIATVHALRDTLPVTDDHVRHGLAAVTWPGRMQEVQMPSGNRLLLDGAHNVAGIGALADELRARYPGVRPTLIFGVLEDKDWPRMLDVLEPVAGRVLFVPVQSNRGLDPEQLTKLTKSSRSLHAMQCSSLEAALRLAQDDSVVVITGSLYLVGEAMELLRLSESTAQDERLLNEWSAAKSKV